MQVSDLYNQVAQLGFEKSLEDEDGFYYAANRAILQVNALRPAIATYVINHKPMKNLVTEASFSPVERAEDLCYEASDAKAYYFEADGKGSVYVEKFDDRSSSWQIIDSVELDAQRRFTAYSGFVKDGKSFVSGPVRLRFSGDYLYSVKCVALYQHIYSDDAADIPPYEAYTRYDIAALAGDFLTLSSPPITEDEEYEKLSGDFDVEGGRVILLPHSAEGCFKVLYNRRPRGIENTGSAAEDDTQIDLDEELCSLLPILIASYVWVDDEPDMSEYYLALYRERAADIIARTKNLVPVNIKNADGW